MRGLPPPWARKSNAAELAQRRLDKLQVRTLPCVLQPAGLGWGRRVSAHGPLPASARCVAVHTALLFLPCAPASTQLLWFSAAPLPSTGHATAATPVLPLSLQESGADVAAVPTWRRKLIWFSGDSQRPPFYGSRQPRWGAGRCCGNPARRRCFVPCAMCRPAHLSLPAAPLWVPASTSAATRLLTTR